MTNYESMVFYSSFYEGIQKIPDDHPELKLQMYDAIMMYGLYGEEIEMDWQIELAWQSIKAQIDANIRKRISGQKGGLVKPSIKKEANSSKTEAQPKQKEAKRKQSEANVNVNENENNNVNEKENANNNVVVNVNAENSAEKNNKKNRAVEYYLNHINKKASAELTEAIDNYVFCGMEEDCIIAIFNYCIDNNKANWAYIDKAIRSNFQDGVHTLEDYNRRREEHEKRAQAKFVLNQKNAFHNIEKCTKDFNRLEEEAFAELETAANR